MSAHEIASQNAGLPVGERASWSLPRAPSVLIVSDVRLVREGIAQALGEDGTLLVIGTAAPDVADQAVARFTPDVALVDMRMPGALEIARALRFAGAAPVVVALGVAESDSALLACAQAGVAGFVACGATTAEVAKAVQSAVRGELVCTPRMAGILLNRIGAMASVPDGLSNPDALTLREHEIAGLIGDGLSNKQIALALGIRNATVKNHVHNILGKLRLTRRSQVGAWLRRLPGVDGSQVRHHPRTAFAVDQTATA
ncbi:LuxR C-terminal-related transcriptional regulator [Mesorhizobium sp. 1B3]|uniref:LuxR C-terminal-related transcriptional regulator n=1 Tax=Mesorhizobium sp. 1B3 TaxID=3243599 RepID=UPI003D984F7A